MPARRESEVGAGEGAGIGKAFADLARGKSKLWFKVVWESVGSGGCFEKAFSEHPHLSACDQGDGHGAFADGSQYSMKDDRGRQNPNTAIQRGGNAADGLAEQECLRTKNEDGLA